jgi:hypothetical protein
MNHIIRLGRSHLHEEPLLSPYITTPCCQCVCVGLQIPPPSSSSSSSSMRMFTLGTLCTNASMLQPNSLGDRVHACSRAGQTHNTCCSSWSYSVHCSSRSHSLHCRTALIIDQYTLHQPASTRVWQDCLNPAMSRSFQMILDTVKTCTSTSGYHMDGPPPTCMLLH